MVERHTKLIVYYSMEKLIGKIKYFFFGVRIETLEEFSPPKETKFDPNIPLTNLPESLKDLKFPLVPGLLFVLFSSLPNLYHRERRKTHWV